jgi:hypothetical protein
MKNRTLRAACLITGCLVLGGCAQKAQVAEAPAETKEIPAQTESPEQQETEPPEEETEEPVETEEESETEEVIEEPDYEAVYAPVLEETLDLIINGYDYEKTYDYIADGLIEAVMYPGDTDLSQEIGYAIMDISGDGVPELLIGYDIEKGAKSEVYGAYTCVDEKPVTAFTGWARSSHDYMGDGNFFYFGSNGAMSSLFGKHHLSEDGTEVVWDDFYFSDEKEDGSLGYFHNTTGMYDQAASEELEIPDEEFWNLMDTDGHYETIPWTPIGLYGGGAAYEEADAKDDRSMYLYADFYRDPTDQNWEAFIETAPDDAVLFVITNPPEELKDLAWNPMMIDPETSDIVIAVSLCADTEIQLESGQIVFNDNDEMLWEPDPSGELLKEKLARGEQSCIQMTIPEGGPARVINISTPEANGMFMVATLSGEWNQHSAFIHAFSE